MLSAATFALWSVAGIVSYSKALHEAGEMLDGQLSQSAKLLLAHLGQDGDDTRMLEALDAALDHASRHPYEQSLEFLLWRSDGKVLFRSKDAPGLEMSRVAGYFDFERAGEPWRGIAAWDPARRVQVQVAERTRDRDHAAVEVAAQVAIPIVVAIPLLAALIYLAVRGALRPLDAMAASVAQRTPENLAALSYPRAPGEIQPLIGALNALLSRLRSTIDNERRFTADAAHELRTPLAALKVHAQVAQLSPAGPAQRESLSRVLLGVDRSVRLVEQMLKLARLDPLQGIPDPKPVSLGPLLHECCAELRPTARERGQSLHCQPPAEEVAIAGDPEMIRLALRNLVENALRYSPRDGAIEAGVTRAGTGTRLWVADNGPGVAPGDLALLTQRFFRGEEPPEAEGSGLGLAIAQRVAELHGARLDLANRPRGGFEAAIVWPGSGA